MTGRLRMAKEQSGFPRPDVDQPVRTRLSSAVKVQEHTATGYVLAREQRGENQWHFALLDPSAGSVWFVQRRPRKGGIPVPDVFDRAKVTFERKGEGPGFVREVEILNQATHLAKNYDAFAAACRFGRILISNGRHWADHATPCDLLHRSLEHWAAGVSPGLVYFKALFLVAQAEGLPVRAQWLAELPAALSQPARAALGASPAASPATLVVPARLVAHLENWLRLEGHFEIPA